MSDYAPEARKNDPEFLEKLEVQGYFSCALGCVISHHAEFTQSSANLKARLCTCLLIKFQALGRESNLVPKLCQYYIVRGYQPVFCKVDYLKKLNNDTNGNRVLAPVLDLEGHEIPGRTKGNVISVAQGKEAHESSEHVEEEPSQVEP